MDSKGTSKASVFGFLECLLNFISEVLVGLLPPSHDKIGQI